MGEIAHFLIDAEAVGFEPTKALRPHAFQACAIVHYATPPELVNSRCVFRQWIIVV